MSQVLPYQNKSGSKRDQVELMFDNIAHRYDFLNHLLSLGIDRLWRRKVILELKNHAPRNILDVATGTGDLAFAAVSALQVPVTGIDISSKMLEQAGLKKSKHPNSRLVTFLKADAESMPFADATFDACTVAFGIRNFENQQKGLNEINRILNRNGLLCVLEFSTPERFPVRQLYLFYFRYLLPAIGRMFTKDKRAYSYLPESVEAFPPPASFTETLRKCGFSPVSHKPLSFGIASLYTALKSD